MKKVLRKRRHNQQHLINSNIYNKSRGCVDEALTQHTNT